MPNILDSVYTDEYVFNEDNTLDKKPGFNAAFGMAFYDSNQEMLNVPEYGQIRGRVRGWNPE